MIVSSFKNVYYGLLVFNPSNRGNNLTPEQIWQMARDAMDGLQGELLPSMSVVEFVALLRQELTDLGGDDIDTSESNAMPSKGGSFTINNSSFDNGKLLYDHDGKTYSLDCKFGPQ